MVFHGTLFSSNFGVIGSIVVIIGIFYVLFKVFKNFGGWSRAKEEKVELAEEENLESSTIKGIKLQRKEKKTINKLIKYFESSLRAYADLISAMESTGLRKTENGQATLNPEEIMKAMQGLIHWLKNVKDVGIPLKSEEAGFIKFGQYWNKIYTEIFQWTYVPNQQMSKQFMKGLKNIKKFVAKINDLIQMLGLELKLEEQLDEQEKKEILALYQKKVREEGTYARAA